MESKEAVLVKREVVPPSLTLQNVVPEHLRPPPSFFQRILRFLRSTESPMLPMTIAVILGHVYLINYLRSDEFKKDFDGFERIPVFTEIKELKKYVKDTFRKYKNIATFQRSAEDEE